MINRRVSLFYRYPLKAFHHMVCPCTLDGVCVVCPGTSELVGQQTSVCETLLLPIAEFLLWNLAALVECLLAFPFQSSSQGVSSQSRCIQHHNTSSVLIFHILHCSYHQIFLEPSWWRTEEDAKQAIVNSTAPTFTSAFKHFDVEEKLGSCKVHDAIFFLQVQKKSYKIFVAHQNNVQQFLYCWVARMTSLSSFRELFGFKVPVSFHYLVCTNAQFRDPINLQ